MHPTNSKPSIANFGAGPAKLPEEVILTAQEDLKNWNDKGIGILEVSHRSKEFLQLISSTEQQVRKILDIPDDYAVLFMQGGGTLQFSAVVYNLLRKDPSKATADYLVGGKWSLKAHAEAVKLTQGTQYQINKIQMSIQSDTNGKSHLAFDGELGGPGTAYLYYCDNETIDGIEMPNGDHIPDLLNEMGIKVPIVADMSSNLLSRPVNISKFGVIFASAQKNLGIAGVTIAIVKRSLLNDNYPPIYPIPTMMDYQCLDQHNSVYNTPPTFGILICNLIFKWLDSKFGSLEEVDKFSTFKSEIIYRRIDESEGFYQSKIAYRYRSRMNIVFRITSSDGGNCSESEALFLKEAEQNGLFQLKGHKSVGGIRVSNYNAITMDEIIRVAEFMDLFARKNRHN